MGKRWRAGLGAALAVAIVAAGTLTASLNADDATAKAVLRNPAGDRVGVVKFIQQGSRALLKVELAAPVTGASAIAPGFHGFHIHAAGVCTPPRFTSAGAHYNPGGTHHGSHAGDLPPLLVNPDGTASARLQAGAFDVADILGKAVIVHVGADNLANIPTRYHSHDTTENPSDAMGADGATKRTGDAGERYACGVIEATN